MSTILWAKDLFGLPHRLGEASDDTMGASEEAVYRCFGCEGKLHIRRRGQPDAYFVHASAGCSYTRYLQGLCKSLFSIELQKAINNGDRFNLCYFSKARGGEVLVDLSTDACEVQETRMGELRVILNSGDQVSIVVGPGSVESSSGLNVRYSPESDRDTAQLLNRYLTYRDPRVEVWGEDVVDDNPGGQEDSNDSLYCVVLFKSGKAALLDAEKIESLHPGTVIEAMPIPPSAGTFYSKRNCFITGVRVLNFTLRPLKNCFVCVYQGLNTRGKHPVFCKLHRKPCQSADAIDCKEFHPCASLSECEEIDYKNRQYLMAHSAGAEYRK